MKFIKWYTLFLLANTTIQADEKPHCKRSYDSDVLVIGCGTAGSIIAKLLTDDPCRKVIALEEGMNFINDPVVLSCDIIDINNVQADDKYSTNFFGRNQEYLFNFTLVNRGKMLGGSQGQTLFFASRSDQYYDDWARLTGNDRWLLKNILPLEKANETYIPFGTVASELRGENGPLVVSQTFPVNNLNLARIAASELNAPLKPDYNVEDLSTSSMQNFCEVTKKAVLRTFSARAYLTPDVMNPDGSGVGKRKLDIRFNSKAVRILFDGKKAIGAEYIINGDRKKICRVFAKKVIVSLGAIVSPQLLILSGIGPKETLKKFCIPTIMINDNVGRHLNTHYGVSAIFTGEWPAPPFNVYANTEVPRGASRSSQFLFLPLVPETITTPALTVINSLHRMETESSSVLAWLLNPRSEGTVSISTRDPLFEPKVTFNFFTDGSIDDPNSDLSQCIYFFKAMKNIIERDGRSLFYPTQADFDGGDGRLAELAFANLNATGNYMGTCRMSQSPTGENGGVVDGNLHVHGVKNLMIADLSVIPRPSAPGATSLIANTIGQVAASIAIEAEKCYKKSSTKQ